MKTLTNWIHVHKTTSSFIIHTLIYMFMQECIHLLAVGAKYIFIMHKIVFFMCPNFGSISIYNHLCYAWVIDRDNKGSHGWRMQRYACFVCFLDS